MKFKHQGDITFVPFNGKITGEVIKHKGSVVLALGEKTGHKHTITTLNVDDMDVWKELDGGWTISLKTEAQVKHDEHATITIAPGIYRVGNEREVDWFAEGVTRQVVD